MLKLHFNRFNNLECYSKYLNLSRKYSVLDFSCGNGATMEIFRHFNNNVTGVDYRDNHLYKHYIESQNLLKNYSLQLLTPKMKRVVFRQLNLSSKQSCKTLNLHLII